MYLEYIVFEFQFWFFYIYEVVLDWQDFPSMFRIITRLDCGGQSYVTKAGMNYLM